MSDVLLAYFWLIFSLFPLQLGTHASMRYRLSPTSLFHCSFVCFLCSNYSLTALLCAFCAAITLSLLFCVLFVQQLLFHCSFVCFLCSNYFFTLSYGASPAVYYYYYYYYYYYFTALLCAFCAAITLSLLFCVLFVQQSLFHCSFVCFLCSN